MDGIALPTGQVMDIHGDYNVVGDNNTVVYGDVYGGGYRPPPGAPFFSLFILLLLLAGVVIKFWWVVLIVVSATAIAYATHLEREEKRQAELEKRRREEALATRAERQNSAYLQGEPWGTFGNFPPPPEVGL